MGRFWAVGVGPGDPELLTVKAVNRIRRAQVIYQLQNNVQLSFTGLFGRPLNFDNPNPPEPFLKRLQFDVIYTF